MSQIKQVHGYSLRQARVAAYNLFQRVNESFNGGNQSIPSELSVKQSASGKGAGEAKTSYTFRFEGGDVIRIKMDGWQTTSFGFQWEAVSAVVRFQKDTSWRAPKLTFLVENLRRELPENEESKLSRVAADEAKRADTLDAFEAQLQSATGIKIRKIRYVADTFAYTEPVWFEEFGFKDGSPWGDLVVVVAVEFFVQYAQEIAAKDEQIITAYLRSKAFRQQVQDGIVSEYFLEGMIQEMTSFHLAESPEFVPAHIYEQAVAMGEEDGSQEVGSAKILILEPKDGYIRKLQVVLPAGVSTR